MTPIRVLLADDHATYGLTLQVMLGSDPEVEVVGLAVDGDDAVRQALALQPDVVLMDVQMPGRSGVEATRLLAEAAPHVAVVVLTMFDDDEVVAGALRAGARGFVLKGARRTDILRVIHAAHAGDSILSGAVARRLSELVSDPADRPPPQVPGLTDREVEVLRAVSAGLDNLAIAASLHLSHKTVRNYVSTVMVKLGVSSRTEAALRGRDLGL